MENSTEKVTGYRPVQGAAGLCVDRFMIQYAELFPANGSWICRYTSEPEKTRVQRLMGTNEIPTAFASAMNFEDVAASLRAIPANRLVAFVEASQ